MISTSLNILYVDDQEDAIDIFKAATAGHSLQFLKNSLSAFDEFRSGRFDIVITDIFMPFVDGFQFYKMVRSVNSRVPFIFLSVDDSHEVVSRGLNLENTQFANRRISAGHLRAMIERSCAQRERVERFGISVDLRLNTVHVNEAVVELTPIEARILDCIVGHEMRIAKKLLKDFVWREAFVSDRTLQTHVGNIREKLSKYNITVKTGRDGYVEVVEEVL